MPKRFKNDIILLADKLNIKITKIKEEGNDIRIYCAGIQRLLEIFDKERLKLLDTGV